ncbi:hypothetical protein [Robertmurraya kyonggiensis]|uniref:Uncharacterized protein n=1 Tax=Robertmurraya kyonggiensis TaxID=1037680 RepID=A0A4U1D9V3_9BACI|nr:hypothetical protein [Robertmurraya kyonggiensis]TKC18206.1 hypothetical protein FA727_01210 [Robertmurraya kyonggiensis]
MRELDDQIMELKQEKYLKEKFLRRLEELQRERQHEADNGKSLRLRLEKELKDVDKLEGVSLSGFFHMIAGKKEERLEKEKEEAFKARILYEESKQKLAELDVDMHALNAKIEEIGDVDERLKAVLMEKEQLIHESDPALSALLNNLMDQKINLEMALKELDEANDAALQAEKALEKADSSLTSAKNWGYMDMAGGGLMSTLIKRSHMDEAKEVLHSAQYYLKRLQAELNDLGKELTTNLEVSDFLHIADLFFDNVFSDWMVQERISASASQVADCLERLEELQRELKTEKNRVQVELQKVVQDRLSYLHS